MKRPINKIARLMISFLFISAVTMSCSDDHEEIFDNAEIQMELESDDEDEQKKKPGQTQTVSQNSLYFSPINKTYQTPSMS